MILIIDDNRLLPYLMILVAASNSSLYWKEMFTAEELRHYRVFWKYQQSHHHFTTSLHKRLLVPRGKRLSCEETESRTKNCHVKSCQDIKETTCLKQDETKMRRTRTNHVNTEKHLEKRKKRMSRHRDS